MKTYSDVNSSARYQSIQPHQTTLIGDWQVISSRHIRLTTMMLLIVAMMTAMLSITPSANAAAAQAKETAAAPTLTSNLTIDLSKPSLNVPVAADTATGSSTITSFTLTSLGASVYRDQYKTWSLNSGNGLSFSLALTHLGSVQLGFVTAAALVNGQANNPIQISVNGQNLLTSAFADTNPNWHTVYWNIPQSMLKATSNTVEFKLDSSATSQYFVRQASVAPQKVYAQNGVLNTTLFAQFGETNTITGAQNADGTTSQTIWTRGYGLSKEIMMIPAPTFYFKPGDLLDVNLNNQLNRDNSTQLNDFENAESANLATSPDETLDNAADTLKHEVNIPHNLDNTNLHVHGLHVDPAKDDVTIVIVPVGASTTGYDAPHSNTPTTTGLNEGSVADQSIKGGSWDYQYKIPSDHLPGTHWYHPHKHGSTAAQVENGMAGSIVIEENSTNAIVSIADATSRQQWQDEHDKVLMIQEIANYGTQKGKGNGNGGASGGGQHNFTPDITINGLHQPTFTLATGQLERWRLVNAGANHLAFAHIWLGKDTGAKDAAGNPIYISEPLNLAASDGITQAQLTEITALNPLLLAPGNRADVLVQLPTSGSYALFKYYPTDISITSSETAPKANLIWDCSKYQAQAPQPQAATVVTVPCSGSLASAFAPPGNPYLFAAKAGADVVVAGTNYYDENYDGFDKTWITQPVPPSSAPTSNANYPFTPIIKVQKNSQSLLDINFALAIDFPTANSCTPLCAASTSGLWQPAQEGPNYNPSKIIPFKILDLIVADSTTKVNSPALPTATHLSRISPTGTMAKIPAYVSPFTDADILQSRPIIFDISGAAITVTDTKNAKNTVAVNQFTLNGRQFALNDPIGNDTNRVNSRLAHGITNATLKQVDTTVEQVDAKSSSATLNIVEGLVLSDHNPSWTNAVPASVGTDPATYYWTNPGYFQSLQYDTKNGYSYTADNTKTAQWLDVSGLSTPAVVNSNHASSASIQGIPGKPVAQTAEEWVLVNNSDVGHPFHIHINPFFVTEVGQLSYEKFSDKSEWVMTAASVNPLPTLSSSQKAPTTPTIYEGNSAISHFVGNWWDTVIVPPHGYVKVRYWINVPNQTGLGQSASVMDNFNKEGVWVFHCHILRHEDRGMMMPVVSQKLITTP